MDLIKHLFGSYVLPTVVFITGACVLIVEVTAMRILSPYFGNTIFTVSSVLSIILAALAVGYYAGGKLADTRPSHTWFFAIIFLSGTLLSLTQILAHILLPFFGDVFPLTYGPLISSSVLFFLPALLLGALSPYAIKLEIARTGNQRVGNASGTIFFFSTLGSIGGSLLAGFFLIPTFGVDTIIFGTSAALILLGAIPLLLRQIGWSFAVLCLVALPALTFAYATSELPAENVVYQEDGVYEKLTVFDGYYEGRPTRFFQQDRSASGAMFLDTMDPTDMVYDYTKYYELYKLFDPDPERVLVIGGGAYSIPKAYRSELPDAVIDVAEIEPTLGDIAKKYFALSDDSKLRSHLTDGRQFLRSAEPYDVIFSDVYYSLYSIPSHFTTREFFELAKAKLTEDGVFIANVIGDLSRQKPSLPLSMMRTMKEVFPESYFIAVNSPAYRGTQNLIFLGRISTSTVDLRILRAAESDLLSTLEEKLIDSGRFALRDHPSLTDSYSPTDYMMWRSLESRKRTSDIDGQEMMAIISQIVGYGPRYLTATGHAEMQKFLIKEMELYADDVTLQEWQHEEGGENSYRLGNVIARFDPERSERVILGTHYDSFKHSFNDWREPHSPTPGANNSASGAAVLIEIARRLSEWPPASDVGVDIVFFDGEEGEENLQGDFSTWQPLGSSHFAKHIDDFYPERMPDAAIILDMVCDKDLSIVKEAGSVRDAKELTDEFFAIARSRYPDTFFDSVRPEIRDDHTPLNATGIPSMLIIDFEYPYYATTRDTPNKCGAESLSLVAESVIRYLSSLDS